MIKIKCLNCKRVVIKKERQKYCSYECYWNSKRGKPNPNHSKRLKKLYKEGKLMPTKGMLGKHHSEEAKEKIRRGNKNKCKKHTKKGIESIRKHMHERPFSIESRKKLSETRKMLFRKGKLINPMLGKKRPDVSKWMKTEKNIRRFNRHPSKPQFKLFKMVKQRYPDAVLEYPVKINNNKLLWLDIAIPSQKLNVEFDGAYWHQNKERDRTRDRILNKLGWHIIRIN